MSDLACPHCGRLNEPQREVCWACCQSLRGARRPEPKADAPGDKKLWRSVSLMRIGSLAGRPLQSPGMEMAPPDGFRLEAVGAARCISWRWFSARAVFALCFAVLWNGFLAFQYRLAVRLGGSFSSSDRIVGLVLGSFGALLAYMAAAYLLNRTIVRIDADMVSARHGPLPWLGDKEIARADIQGITSEKMRHVDETLFQPLVTYSVKLSLRDASTVRLVTGLREPDEALFIEQELRKP